jgi:ParB-like chromosome segregation protein Spo0J
LLAAIREFGFRQPIVVDERWSHHLRPHSLQGGTKAWDWTQVPVHVAKDLTPEQIKAYRIADNKTAELAEWNYDLAPDRAWRICKSSGFDLSLLGLRWR